MLLVLFNDLLIAHHSNLEIERNSKELYEMKDFYKQKGARMRKLCRKQKKWIGFGGYLMPSCCLHVDAKAMSYEALQAPALV